MDGLPIPKESDYEVLFGEKDIRRRGEELAIKIVEDYLSKGVNRIISVGLMKGAQDWQTMVEGHMARLYKTDFQVLRDFMVLSSYENEFTSQSELKTVLDLKRPIAGQHVLIFEDICDTGITLDDVINRKLLPRKPASLTVCVMIDKQVEGKIQLPLDYVGFEIPNRFVVGYGLDYHGLLRNMREVVALKPGFIQQVEQYKREQSGK